VQDEEKVVKKASELHLRDSVRVVYARKWLVLLSLLISVGASFFYLNITPPVYESQVLMMRETASEKLPADIIGITIAAEKWDGSQELLLKSGSSLAEIRQRLLDEHNYEVTIEQLEEDISLSAYKQDSKVIKLTANANTPEQAQALANVAVDTLIKRVTEMKGAELNQGLKFLEQQMTQFEGRLHETERTLSDFRDKEGLAFTSGTASGGLIERLGSMQGELLQTQSDVELAKAQLQSV